MGKDTQGVVRDSPHWDSAVRLLGGGEARTFRASCACATTKAARGFGHQGACMTMGGGVLRSRPGWTVDLYDYGAEVYGFVWGRRFACGLVLGGEWRTTSQSKNFKFSVAPFGEHRNRPYMATSAARSEATPWWMPKLRPSTALLLLLLAGVRDGDVVLDPMGGAGTIAIEAAIHFDVNATTSDNDRAVTRAAVRNVVRARSFFRGRCIARDLDTTKLPLPNRSVDRLVTDTPFGHRCRWDIRTELPLLLDETARLLTDTGRAVLLLKGYRRTEELLLNDPDRFSRLTLVERRPVNVGGYLCYALVLKVDLSTNTGDPRPPSTRLDDDDDDDTGRAPSSQAATDNQNISQGS